MKFTLELRKLCGKAIYNGVLILLILSCSASKDYDETPLPIGGDMRLRQVFQLYLGNAMYDLRGRIITFSIKINEAGNIRWVSIQRGVGYEYDQMLETAMKTHISFTPATKNGKSVEAQFTYSFRF